MANVTVHEFTIKPDSQGNIPWPPSAKTKVSSPASVTLSTSTLVVVITCDANTTMTWDGSSATNADVPLLSAVPNQFNVSPNSGPKVTFQ